MSFDDADEPRDVNRLEEDGLRLRDRRLVIAGRHHDHWNVGEARAAADFGQDRLAAQARQVQVEHDGVGRRLIEVPESRDGVRRDVDVEAGES